MPLSKRCPKPILANVLVTVGRMHRRSCFKPERNISYRRVAIMGEKSRKGAESWRYKYSIRLGVIWPRRLLQLSCSEWVEMYHLPHGIVVLHRRIPHISFGSSAIAVPEADLLTRTANDTERNLNLKHPFNYHSSQLCRLIVQPFCRTHGYNKDLTRLS